MAEPNEGGKRDFDGLLDDMPRIAEAVNAFPESVQQQAFDALVDAFWGGGSATVPEAGSRQTKGRRRRSPGRTREPRDETTTRRRSSAPTVLRDLDLAPRGETSLKDFVAEKHPKSQHDKNVVAVYYLTEKIGITPVTIDHVLTCYRDRSWPIPTSLANSLAQTSSKKRYLDTADLDGIRLMPAGTNHVEHDLPAKKKTKGD